MLDRKTAHKLPWTRQRGNTTAQVFITLRHESDPKLTNAGSHPDQKCEIAIQGIKDKVVNMIEVSITNVLYFLELQLRTESQESSQTEVLHDGSFSKAFILTSLTGPRTSRPPQNISCQACCCARVYKK